MLQTRSRWAAVGAAVAITLGAGGVGLVDADVSSGDRTVLVPITPCRLLDTRPEFLVGNRATPLGTAETHVVSAHGTPSNSDCTIPADAVGLSLNFTAVGATQPTFLTIWASGQPQPDASSLNPAPGQPPTPNAVVTELSADGKFSVFNLQGNVDILADVNGYYAHHTHDDRYYRRAQVDDIVAANSPWETIPSGRTVRGNFVFDSALITDGEDHLVHVPLPARAPTGLTAAAVNFAVDSSADTTDDDPACAGTLQAPSAPPGKVCIYLSQLGSMDNVRGDSAAVFILLTDAGFLVRWRAQGTPGVDMFLHATWAYTAP